MASVSPRTYRIDLLRRVFALAAAAVLSVGLLAGCGSTGGTAVTPSTSASSAESSGGASGSPSSGSSSDQPSANATTAKVNANTAPVAELAAAFAAAGVPNAGRWAREVEEYRPYTGTDDWAHLREELAKYNIDDATFAEIVSVLGV